MFLGNGVYMWIDGAKYVGEFHYNHKHGHGKYTWSDGREFEGSW